MERLLANQVATVVLVNKALYVMVITNQQVKKTARDFFLAIGLVRTQLKKRFPGRENSHSLRDSPDLPLLPTLKALNQ